MFRILPLFRFALSCFCHIVLIIFMKLESDQFSNLKRKVLLPRNYILKSQSDSHSPGNRPIHETHIRGWRTPVLDWIPSNQEWRQFLQNHNICEWQVASKQKWMNLWWTFETDRGPLQELIKIFSNTHRLMIHNQWECAWKLVFIY